MNKTKRLSIKLLPSDKAALDRLAQAEGEAYAVIVRRLIRQAAIGMGVNRQAVEPIAPGTPHSELDLAETVKS